MSLTNGPERIARVKLPVDRRTELTKPEIAIEEIDRVKGARARFGCVLADAGYSMGATFRQALSERSGRGDLLNRQLAFALASQGFAYRSCTYSGLGGQEHGVYNTITALWNRAT